MKKLFFLMAILMACFALSVGCSDNNDSDKDIDEPAGPQYRVKTYSQVGDGWADVYQYFYDEQGRVAAVYREPGKDWTFKYQDNKISITNKEVKDDGSTDVVPFLDIELNAAGYAAKTTDKYGDVREYTYNPEGHVIQIRKNGEVKSDITIEDGCIVQWTRMKDGAWQIKDHTYYTEPNTFSIHNIHSEATDPGRWLYETGLFGIPSAYLCSSSKWQHSDKMATYTYDKDPNGCITNEHKLYNGKYEEFEYTWEEFVPLKK